MFQVGPGEFLVLAIVAIIVIGPDRLPGLARDAARLIKTLRELATGAQSQLRDELGPEFADLDLGDLRNLNPRAALQRAILGDDAAGLKADLRKLDPRSLVRETWDEADAATNSAAPNSSAPNSSAPNSAAPNSAAPDSAAAAAGSGGSTAVSMHKPVSAPAVQPLGRHESAPYDSDAT